MLLEMIYLAKDREDGQRMFELLKRKTEKAYSEQNEWWKYLCSLPANPHPFYADFKPSLYALIDPKFRGYFSTERTTKISLDEVRWGGFRQDGIPPLRGSKMIGADEADYLKDSNVIFGLEV